MVGLLGIAALVPLLTVSIVARRGRRRGRPPAPAARLRPRARRGHRRAARQRARGRPEPAAAVRPARPAATAAYAFQRPARNALTPKLVPDDQLLAAIAVEDVVFNLSRVAGPALAGLLIGTVGLRRRVRVRPRDLRRLARRDLAPAAPAEDRGRREREPALDPRGLRLRPSRAGAARDLHRRHGRDDLRDAERALPGVRRGARRRRLDGGAAVRRAVRRRASWRRSSPAG